MQLICCFQLMRELSKHSQKTDKPMQKWRFYRLSWSKNFRISKNIHQHNTLDNIFRPRSTASSASSLGRSLIHHTARILCWILNMQMTLFVMSLQIRNAHNQQTQHHCYKLFHTIPSSRPVILSLCFCLSFQSTLICIIKVI